MKQNKTYNPPTVFADVTTSECIRLEYMEIREALKSFTTESIQAYIDGYCSGSIGRLFYKICGFFPQFDIRLRAYRDTLEERLEEENRD